MNLLSEQEIKERLKNVENWTRDDKAIKREWIFQDFVEAMDFINMIAVICEAHNHHPELFNVYNRVSLRFYTHSANGLTEQDFAIAEEIDKL